MGGLNFHTSRKTYPNDITDAQGSGNMLPCPSIMAAGGVHGKAKCSDFHTLQARPHTKHHMKRGSCAVGNVCKVCLPTQ